MKNKRIWLTVCAAAAVILELLPYGAVLNFGTAEGEPCRQTYSYFSLTPFGYANFGPLLTAVLSVILLAFCVLYAAKGYRWCRHVIREGSVAAAILSLLPLMYGLRSFSVIGALITLLLAAMAVISFLRDL